jgi:hypothetical protein
MPLPHYGGNNKPFKPGKYREYVYLGEDIDASKLIWDKNLTTKLQKNNIYRLYEDKKEEGEISYYEETNDGFIYLLLNDQFFITRVDFGVLIECGVIVPISKYREKRIDDIFKD